MIPDYLPESGTALEGRVALVTGAASGIGEAVSRIYASNGAKVAMIDLDAARLAEVAADIRERGGDVLDIVADVVDEEPMLMMRPPVPAPSQWRNASRQQRKTPVRLGPIVLFHSSSVTWVTGGASESRPALLISRSRRP